METTAELTPPTDFIERLKPLLTLASLASDCVLHLGDQQPLTRQIRKRTGLTPEGAQAVAAVDSTDALMALWHEHMPDYYHCLLVGRLVLESPLKQVLEAILCSDSGWPVAQFEALVAATIRYVCTSTPITERWLIGERSAQPNDPPPTDPALVAELAGWVERRQQLEQVFADAQPELRKFTDAFLPFAVQAAADTAPKGWQPDRRGPFLRRTFTESELSALRLLLTYLPDLATLLPDYPLALALQSLSGFQPAERLADMRRRLHDQKANQPLHLSLADSILLLQTVQAAALLLLRDTVERLSRMLRRRLDINAALDDECRADCGRLLFLLTDATTSTQFRAVFGPLTKSFVAAVDRTYPYHTEITQARAEVAELAALR